MSGSSNRRLKAAVIAAAAAIWCACSANVPKSFEIGASKTYEASIFRQQCAICHGPEAEGRTLDDGKVVPSLRSGEHKFKSEAEVYKQISEGGNGMTPFRDILTEREIRLMVKFVRDDLRQGKE